MSGSTLADRAKKREVILRCIAAGVTPDSAIAERAGCGITMIRKIRREIKAGKKT